MEVITINDNGADTEKTLRRRAISLGLVAIACAAPRQVNLLEIKQKYADENPWSYRGKFKGAKVNGKRKRNPDRWR